VKMDKISYPSMGIYTQIIGRLGDYLKWELIPPATPSETSIAEGARHMNELMCLPAKVGLGQFIEACKQGANKLIMFDSCGECRLKCYWILQERVLRKLGYEVTVYPIRLGKGTVNDIRRIDPSISYWKALVTFLKILRDIYHLDKQQYEIPEQTNLVKIGIVGEIYTILESAINRRLVEKIEKMGALVHNSLPLSYFIFKGFYNRGWMTRQGMDMKVWREAKDRAHRYFPQEIGGHGNESIFHTIYYALKGFDGVIHVLPFPCMPESTVATVLDDIHRDYGIAVMRLIFDTHTGEAGLDTRLEAFVDILKRRKHEIIKKQQSLKIPYDPDPMSNKEAMRG